MKNSEFQANTFISKHPELEERYGSIFVIAAITTIIFNSIRIYKYCKEKRKNNRQLYYGLFRINLLDRMKIRQQVRKAFPGAPKEDVLMISEGLIKQAQELNYSEFNQLLKDHN